MSILLEIHKYEILKNQHIFLTFNLILLDRNKNELEIDKIKNNLK